MTEKKFITPWLFVPLLVMVLLAFFVSYLSNGRSLEQTEYNLSLLKADYVPVYSGSSDTASTVIVYDSSLSYSEYLAGSISSILDSMQLEYRQIDVSVSEIDYSGCSLMIMCLSDLNRIPGHFDDFARWLDTGSFIWCCTPEFNSRLNIVSSLVGITQISEDMLEDFQGLTFKDDILPGLEGRSLPDIGLGDNCLVVSLNEDCTVSVTEAETDTPVIWTYKNGYRTASVFNLNCLYEKNVMNGIFAHVVSRHIDYAVWPIMNSLLVYIDDFPAPQPEGFDERLKEQFGYNTQSFYMNVWWPDMKELAESHGIKYTGVLVETYNLDTEYPFDSGTAGTLLRYYGAELVNTGGEISLHGYNHQPLIPLGYPNLDDYAGWPDAENMRLASEELLHYAEGIFPELTFVSYVPPSNYLSDEGYEAIKDAVPGLKVISGLYYDYEGGTSYHGEFEEFEDGIINVPRITSGFSMEDFDKLIMYSTIFDHGVLSHFIHPDDVLDEDRGALLGWNKMLSDLNDELDTACSTYPCIRGMTALSGGGAVERMQRLRLSTEVRHTSIDSILDISLDGFTDNAWLALCIDGEISAADGCEVFPISGNYYWVRCDRGNVSIAYREG